MEEQRVDLPREILHRGHRRVRARGDDVKAWRGGGDKIAVTGPDAQLRWKRREERAGWTDLDRRMAELT